MDGVELLPIHVSNLCVFRDRSDTTEGGVRHVRTSLSLDTPELFCLRSAYGEENLWLGLPSTHDGLESRPGTLGIYVIPEHAVPAGLVGAYERFSFTS